MSYRVSARVRLVLVTGILIVVSVPVLLGWLLLQQSRQADVSYELVEHTHEVLTKVDNLRNVVREAESAQRAYMLTKSQTFAASYKQHREGVPKALEALALLVRDNPHQSARTGPLRKVLSERLALLDDNTNNVDMIGSEALNNRLENSAKKAGELEQKLITIKEEELQLLDARRERLLVQRLEFQQIAGATSFMGLLALLGGGYILYRENRNREQYERRLSEARDAALDSVKTTSAFVASVSHEIRTPMNGVLGAADLLLRDTTLSAKQRDGVETIRTSGKALLAIINDILDLSKLQVGEMKFVSERFSPANVVDEVVKLFSEPAARKGLKLASHLDPDLPAQVMGDRLRLRQVLVNLTSNAVKFTDKGSVTIHVVRRRQMETENRVCLRIDVSDTGPGIAKGSQDQLFVPFSQVDTRLSARHGGTGLGLAISRELVQRMNGTLNVESTPGQGSTFWFTVVFEASTEISTLPKLKGSTLVIVESRPTAAESIRAHAAHWGLQTLVAANCRSLPSALDPGPSGNNRSGQPGAIVVGVPSGESWHDTVRGLRQRNWANGAPIYVMPDGEEVTVELLQKIGVAGLLKYPFNPSELYNHLAGTHEPQPARTPDRLDLAPSHILVADDNPVNQRVLSNQLDYLGMKVTVCSDGAEALALAKEGWADLILMDCQMPIMDGFEATRQIRAWEKTGAGGARKHVPIIAVTAHVMSGDAELCLEAGMDSYLAKPVEVDRLQRALSKWLLRVPASLPSAAPDADGPPSSPGPQTAQTVDESQLKLCLTGEPDLDHELVRMAAHQMSDVLVRMETALNDGADKAWREAAHLGRGSGATMGFMQLSALFYTAEFEATGRDARFHLLTELQEALTALDAKLVELGYLPETLPTP